MKQYEYSGLQKFFHSVLLFFYSYTWPLNNMSELDGSTYMQIFVNIVQYYKCVFFMMLL